MVTGTFVGVLPRTFAPESENDVKSKKSKTWNFRSPCFKCVFLSKVTRIALSMLNTYVYAVASSYNLLTDLQQN